MNSDKVKDWFEIIGLLAVVASLVFVGLEIRQSSLAAAEESLTGDLANLVAVEEIVATNPGVWLRGCKGEELSDEDQVAFTHIYHSYEYLYFLRWLRGERGVHGALEEVTIDNMAMNLYRYPGIANEWQRHWQTRRQLSDEGALHQWRDLVEARLAEYPSFEPEPINEPFRCGLN